MTNTTTPAPFITHFVRVLAKRHGLRRTDVVSIARDLDLTVILRPTGVGTKTEWYIAEERHTLAMLDEHLATLTA